MLKIRRFMTFAPEWLSGNTNLDGSNFMYLWVAFLVLTPPCERFMHDADRAGDVRELILVSRWVYLFFFNMLWVWFPLWVLYEAYGNITAAFSSVERTSKGKKKG
jgi:hypothetical protein